MNEWAAVGLSYLHIGISFAVIFKESRGSLEQVEELIS